MRFQGTFSRGDRSIPVEGEVEGDEGTLRFPREEAASIQPGTGKIATSDGEKWNIEIPTTTIDENEWAPKGICAFRIVSRKP